MDDHPSTSYASKRLRFQTAPAGYYLVAIVSVLCHYGVMRRQRATFRLSDEEIKTLRGWERQGTAEHRMVERARMVLLAHAGRTNQQIAEQLHTRSARVSKWRQRF